MSSNSNPTSPRSSTNNQDSPVKMVQSPRKNGEGIYFGNLNGYGGGGGTSSIQNIASRKSDTSVYSVASSSNGGTGRDQGIQTDLSMDKITTSDQVKDNLSPLEAAKQFLSREALAPKGSSRREQGQGDGDRRAYQLEESVEDVIDMLNNCRIENTSIKTPTRPSPLHHTRILGVTKVGLPSVEGVGSSGSSSSKRVSISSTSSSQDNQYLQKNNNPRLSMDDKPLTRFKEIHFDGNKAREQAKVLVMTRQTAQAPSQGSSSKPPVVTRRRIAAAIFND